MSPLTETEQERLLDEARLITLSTTNPNGTIHRPSTDAIRERATWAWTKYLDDDQIPAYMAPLTAEATCLLEIRADKIVGWHP